MKVSELALLVSQSDGKATLEVAGRPLFQLNSVAVLIWKNLSSGLSAQEIVSQLAISFNISEERAALDVGRFIDRLAEHMLVLDDAQLTDW